MTSLTCQTPLKMRWRLWVLSRLTGKWFISTEHTWQPESERMEQQLKIWRDGAGKIDAWGNTFRPHYIEWLPQCQ